MGGGGVVTQTLLGVFGLRGALSTGEFGTGFSAAFDWSVINFRGLTGNRGESFRISAEYRSAHFQAPGDIVTTADGIIARPSNYKMRIDAFYSMPFLFDTSATLAARYLVLHDEEPDFLSYAYLGNRYGIDLTLSRALSVNTSAAFTIGYAKEPTWLDLTEGRSGDGEFRAMLRLTMRPDSNTSLTASHDTLRGTSDVSAYRSAGNGIGRWQVSVNAQHHADSDTAAATSSASYQGNRTEVVVSHSTGFADGPYLGFDGRPTNQRTSARIGTSIAFADGSVAIGAPIRNNAFAIVVPHASIADKEITVGSGTDIRAKSDWLGPAVVSNIPSYHPSSIPIDVAGLPVGYSLGAAAFDTFAPYKAGYRLEVGSAYSVYVHGTLLLTNGEPVALLTGIARPVGTSNKEVPVFTNAAGRFGAEGLAPGRWTIEMATPDQPTIYTVEIPAGADGLFKAGTLYPKGAT
jgi:outer membrane usher protein